MVEYIYKLIHKKTKAVFVGGRGQTKYTRPGFAVLSFNNIYGKNKFENQDEWEVVAYKLVKVRGYKYKGKSDE